jgi:hypothetical protein
MTFSFRAELLFFCPEDKGSMFLQNVDILYLANSIIVKTPMTYTINPIRTSNLD